MAGIGNQRHDSNTATNKTQKGDGVEDMVSGATLRGAAAGGMTLDELFGTVEQEWQDQALCAQTDPEAFFLSLIHI